MLFVETEELESSPTRLYTALSAGHTWAGGPGQVLTTAPADSMQVADVANAAVLGHVAAGPRLPRASAPSGAQAPPSEPPGPPRC